MNSSLVYNLRFGSTFRTKMTVVWLGLDQKNVVPLLISAIPEASNFKFSTQLKFGE